MKGDWIIEKLGNLTEIITKGTTPTSVGFKFETEGVNFIKIESITLNGNFIKNKFSYISHEANKALKRSQLREGDILFSIAGALGRTAIVTNDILPANTNQALSIIRLKTGENVLKEYILLVLNSGYALKQVEKFKGGVAQQNLSLGQMKNFQIPIPSIFEQRQIVSILDQVFTKIEKAKTNIEKNIENTKELFQSKLNEIFSQRGGGWEQKILGEVCENLDSRRVPITKSKRIQGDIPYYGASGVVDYVKDFLFDENLLLVSEDGANLLARKYPIAFSISGKTWVNNHAHVLRFKNEISQFFVEYYLNSIKLDKYISGMAQPKLNQRKLNSILIPFPSLNTQTEIVILIKKLIKNKSSIISNYLKKLQSLEELKKSILQKAFSGELKTSEVAKTEKELA